MAVVALHIHALSNDLVPPPRLERRTPRYIKELLFPRCSLVLVPLSPRRTRFLCRLLDYTGIHTSHLSSNGRVRGRPKSSMANGRAGAIQITSPRMGRRGNMLAKQSLVRLGPKGRKSEMGIETDRQREAVSVENPRLNS